MENSLIGFDFQLIWNGLHAFIQGGNPYALNGYFYPPLFTLLFSPLGLLPEPLALLLLLLATLAACLRVYRWRFVYWLPFTPVLYELTMGQFDLLLVALARGIRPNWRGVAVTVLVTVKPQLALILLPYILLRLPRQWFFRWGVVTAAAWLITALCFPALTGAWMAGVTSGAFGHQGINTPSLWSVAWLIPPFLIALLCIGVLIWSIRRDEGALRSALLSVSPVGYFYGTVALIEHAPPALLVPVSILAFWLAEQTALPVWFVLIPLTALAYHLVCSLQGDLAHKPGFWWMKTYRSSHE